MPDTAYDVTWTNRAAFEAMLAGLTADLGDLGAPINQVARSTVSEAVAASPKRSGAMASAHRQGPGRHGKGSALITVGTVYAAPQHWGWRAHGIARKPWVVAVFRRDAGWRARFGDDLQHLIDKEAART